MRKWLKYVIWIVLVLLVGAQFIRPRRENPPVDSKLEIGTVHRLEPGVSGILERSCNDCHSNHTNWPRYSSVAPASWLVVSDVIRGRKAMNYSEWGHYPAERRQRLLGEICNEVTEGDMPGIPYMLMHPRARLTAAEVLAVCRWTRNVATASAQASDERQE
jgi:Haem-binding domain